MSAAFPPVAELLPHAGEMVFLTDVLEHTETGTVCSVEVGAGPFIEPDGRVGAWIGIEYMAQCIAAHGILTALDSDEPPRIGMLLGSRRIRLHSGHFETGQRLIVRAKPTWGQRSGLVAFECSLECATTGALLAEGRLNCFLAEQGQFDTTEESQ